MSQPQAAHEQWLEISVILPAEFAEPVTHLFSTYCDGRVSVSQSVDWDLDDTSSNRISSDNVKVHCYLKFDDTVEHRKGMIDVGLRLMAELTDIEDQSERLVTSEEWSNQSFPEIRVGDHIVISPWSIDDGIPEQSDTDGIQIFLSPGLAFGTGNHPTTRLCLNQIFEDYKSSNLEECRVLDVGCGSGILAIASLKFGAKEAWCLDIDETAIRAVQDNLVMSGVSDRAHVYTGSVPNPNLPDTEFDYVLANITSRVLIDLAKPLIHCAKAGGTILASGILAEQLDGVREAFLATESVSITDTCQEGDWVMLKMVKLGNSQ